MRFPLTDIYVEYYVNTIIHFTIFVPRKRVNCLSQNSIAKVTFITTSVTSFASSSSTV